MACKKCISVCPKGIIDLIPKNKVSAAVLCKNHDKGAQTRKDCTVGCIGCTKCVKACPQGAIEMDNGVAKVNPEKCTACGECNNTCPVKAINLLQFN